MALSGRGGTTGSRAGARGVVGDRRAVAPAAARSPAGWWYPVRRGPGGVHRGRLRADHRLRLAAPADRVRRVQGHRPPPVRRVDRGRVVASAAPGGAGSARRAGGDRLVPRGGPGSKLHVLTDRNGLPLAVAVSAANTHDSLALIPLVQAVPAIRSRRGPRRRRPDRLHARLGLRLSAPALLAALPADHAAHRPPWHRDQ